MGHGGADWAVAERARARRGRERRLFSAAGGGDLRVCLAYPHAYPVAMANLGFQVVYALIAGHPRATCERAFLPDADQLDGVRRGHLTSFETERPVCDFDLLAFSVSFETDYANILRMLDLTGLPLRAADRGPGAPLVIAGGPATFLNPEPIADFVDLFLIGEGEEMVPEFLDRLCRLRGGGMPRGEALHALAGIEGAYVPALYRPRYAADGRLERVDFLGSGSPTVRRRRVPDLNRFPTTSRILSPDCVFGDMYLVEASRGCGWGCRFCAAGYAYRPVRNRSLGVLEGAVDEGLQERETIGLVGAEIASLPGIVALCDRIGRAGARASPSSLRANAVTVELARSLGSQHSRSVTVAPDAGSERMRRVINKNLTEAEILRATQWLVGEGIESLKFYFMVGLPTEAREDVEAIVELTRRVRAVFLDRRAGRRRVGRIVLSVNPFVPKPWTPFQWDGMEEIRRLREKCAFIQREASRLGGVEVETESPRQAYFQALLSRGDRRVGALLETIHAAGAGWWGVLQAGRRAARRGGGAASAVNPDVIVHGARDADELLPWDFIDHGIHKAYLLAERRRAAEERQTMPCDVSTCRACGVC